MKKSTLFIASLCLAVTTAFSQSTVYTTAPPNIGSTTQLRAPNGLNTHAYFRGATIVPATELTGIAASTTLSSFGFTTTAGADAAVTGTIIVYLQNTSDATYLKGTSWSTIISPMTMVYTGTITIPTTATTMDLPLTTPFTFTGGGLYVAYDFYSPGPYATSVPATYAANNSLASSHYSASDPGLAPTTLTATSAFRPCFRFAYANPLTNDVSVDDIETLGNLPILFGTSYQIQATVRNTGSAAVTNVGVGVGITGANTFTSGVIVSSLAAGSSTLVTFPAWTPAAQGLNTITVGVPADQNNANNSLTFKQKVSCNAQGTAQTPMSYTGSVGYGTGSGIIAADFRTPVAATVTGANLAISTGTANAGNPVYAVLLDNTGTILAQSNTITLTPAMYGTLQSFTFTAATPVSAATDYFIGLAQA
ncbi:MAG: CARDB domain-containing protein, partial [Bacteroidia bacterium]